MTDATEALLSLSPMQAIGLWEELMTCLYKDNGYGTSVAEVYMYTVMPSNPLVSLSREGKDAAEEYRRAGRVIYELCRLFEQRHEVTLALFEGPRNSPLPLSDLIDKGPWVHRVHIGVTKWPKRLTNEE